MCKNIQDFNKRHKEWAKDSVKPVSRAAADCVRQLKRRRMKSHSYNPVPKPCICKTSALIHLNKNPRPPPFQHATYVLDRIRVCLVKNIALLEL